MSFCSNIKYRIITAGIQTPSGHNFRIVCYIFIVVVVRTRKQFPIFYSFNNDLFFCFILPILLFLSFYLDAYKPWAIILYESFVSLLSSHFFIDFDFDLDNSNLIFPIYSIKFNVWYIYESIYIWHSVVLQSGKYQCLVQWMKYGSVRYSMYVYVCATFE